MKNKKEYLKCDAIIIGDYRYSLTRIWDDNLDRITFIMIDPSTANATEDDLTILSYRRQAENWGYGGFEVVNLFAYKSTDTTVLNDIKGSIIGEDNDNYIKSSIEKAHKIVLAWGNALTEKKVKVHLERVNEVIELLGEMSLYCIGLTDKGCPKHPLYCNTTDKPIEIVWSGGKDLL